MMANSQWETLKPSQNLPFPFPPHRRRPLQSGTYRTFVRIMSHCSALQSLPQQNKQGEAAEENKLVEVNSTHDDDGKTGEAAEENKLVEVNRLAEAAEQNELLKHDPMETESLLVQLKSAANVTEEAPAFQGGDVTDKKLEDPMNITMDNNNGNHVGSFIEDNQTIDGLTNLIAGQKDGCNVADTTEFSLTRREEADKQAFLNEVPEAVDSSLELEMDMVAELSRPIEHGDDKNSIEEKTFSEGMEHELQLKEKELEKLISSSSVMNSSICPIVNDDIEEGEISGDIGVYDEVMDFLLDDVVSLEEKNAEEVQIHKDNNDKEESACDGRESGLVKYGRSISASLNTVANGKDIMKLERQSTRKDPDAYAETLADGGDIEFNKVDGQDIVLETGQIMDGVQGTDHRAAFGQVISEGTTENKDLAMNEKENGVEKKKRKKGPLSKERKAKKKRKERIKRAEKNRKLGVKRLKLQPILKPKTVTYCRHYLNGRCQEGEKCKFSHDTTPLTKSKPCCHFARHSCMKGDDCPFDHQLSKYPCNNYVANGFCGRGSECLFSHKMPDKEGSLMNSSVPKPEFKSPIQTSDSNSKKQVKIHSNPHQNSTGKSTEKKVAQHLQRPATQVPKGISVLSHLRFSPGDTSKHEQAAQPLKGDYGVKIGHKMISSSFDSSQKSNGITNKAPMRAPKGINFLSFGKAPQLDSGSNKDHDISESLLGEINGSKLLRSPQKNDGGAKTENQSGQSSLESEPNKNKMAREISPASRPQGIKFLVFAELPADNSSAVRDADLLPHNINSALPLVQKRENALDGLKFSNEMPCRLACSPNPFCQSSHQSGPRNVVGVFSSQKTSILSNTPSSTQKALKSTLAFAAKFDSAIKLDQSIGVPAASNESNQQSSSMMWR